MNIIKEIESWYLINKRNLPWRKNINPYNIWLSEIIMQQTNIKQGLPYYCNFIKKFPNLKDLSESTQEVILKNWQGLGYYYRAQNLYKTAQYLYQKNNGEFPKTHLELEKLNGIGKYISCAISSICFNERVPALDCNAFRLYSRFFGIFLDPQKKSSYNFFFKTVQPIIPENSGNFNQAIMDLGAMICIVKNPKCEICPLLTKCFAFKNNQIKNLPLKRKKNKIINVSIKYFIYYSKDFIILNKREKSFWKNLYEFSQKNFFTKKKYLTTNISHKLSHRKLNIEFNYYKISNKKLFFLCKKYNQKYFNKIKIDQLTFPKPIEIFLKKILLN